MLLTIRVVVLSLEMPNGLIDKTSASRKEGRGSFNIGPRYGRLEARRCRRSGRPGFAGQANPARGKKPGSLPGRRNANSQSATSLGGSRIRTTQSLPQGARELGLVLARVVLRTAARGAAVQPPRSADSRIRSLSAACNRAFRTRSCTTRASFEALVSP